MDGVIYREYQPNDFDMLSEIIKITWNHGKYYSYGVSCRVADAYLRFCLSEQTFAQVAEVNEKTVGIIIGNNFLKRHFHFNYFLYAMYDIICLSMSKEGRNAWRFFRNIDKIYKELLSLQIKKYDGELSFFVVHPLYRNFGIGNELYNRFYNYAKINKINNFYVFTDTSCNYNFYEKRNMKKCGEKVKEVTNVNCHEKISFFMYENIYNQI